MASLIDIHKSAYINSNIEIYSQNKIGQYSKFFGKTPIEITYYSINQQQTRADAGNGTVQNEIGDNSPMRYNKILGFPVYGIPEIKPSITLDDTGIDIEIDLSDITILPNTVKPAASDYMLLKLPGGTKELLFRVNNFTFNTVQSNDFYLIDIEIKDIGTNLAAKLEPQVVETYQTIFDNIGTQDKCFIIIEDYEKAKAIVKLYYLFRERYRNIFFDIKYNSFILKNNIAQPGYNLYDLYISKFITDTDIFFTPHDEETLVLTYNDLIPSDMDNCFNKTLLGAVCNRSIDYLQSYVYYYQAPVTKPFSPLILSGGQCNSLALMISPVKLTNANSEAFRNGYLSEFFSVQLVEDIKNNVLTSTDYLDEIIFNYLTGKSLFIDRSKLIQYEFTDDIRTYMYLPVIIYIIRQYYDEYFKKTQ